MVANDNKSYLSYLNNLVNQYNNTYHHSVNKKLAKIIESFCEKELLLSIL